MAGRRHFGSVRKRASGRRQAAYFHEGKRHAAPTTFVHKADAQAFLSLIEARSLLACHLLPAFGHLPIAEVTPTQVGGWVGGR